MTQAAIDLPFSVDRADEADLTEQIARGLRGEIHNGAFAPGDRLPGVREIARSLGTSSLPHGSQPLPTEDSHVGAC